MCLNVRDSRADSPLCQGHRNDARHCTPSILHKIQIHWTTVRVHAAANRRIIRAIRSNVCLTVACSEFRDDWSHAMCSKLIGYLIRREIVVALNILDTHGLELVRYRWASRDSPVLEKLALLSLSRIHLTPHPLFIYRAPSQFIHVPLVITMLF